MGTHGHQDTEGDINLVEIWLRRDPTRWIAGALAGVFSGLVACAFGMLLALLFGSDVWYPAKALASPILGPEAMNFGIHAGIAVGLGVWAGLGAVLGAVYAHFTGTNSLPALLGVGLSWGAFSWVFLNNLFLPSFRAYMVLHVSGGAAFFVCLVFGIALTSTAFFDRMLRR